MAKIPQNHLLLSELKFDFRFNKTAARISTRNTIQCCLIRFIKEFNKGSVIQYTEQLNFRFKNMHCHSGKIRLESQVALFEASVAAFFTRFPVGSLPPCCELRDGGRQEEDRDYGSSGILIPTTTVSSSSSGAFWQNSWILFRREAGAQNKWDVMVAVSHNVRKRSLAFGIDV